MNQWQNIESFEFLAARYALKAVAKILLDLNNISQAGLAKETGLNVQTVYGTLNGHRKNPHVMAAVSRKLGIPAGELFGNGRP